MFSVKPTFLSLEMIHLGIKYKSRDLIYNNISILYGWNNAITNQQLCLKEI